MKNLNRVQKISKVLKVLSNIAFVFCIIGCAVSLIAIPVVAIYGNNPELLQLLAQEGIEFVPKQILCSCICAAIECGAMIALYFYVVRFFKQELECGTPFDEKVVKGMRLIGILHIAIPCGVIFVTAIISACFGFDTYIVLSDTNLVLGIAYLLFSFVLAHGVEIKEAAKKAIEQPIIEVEKQEDEAEDKQ